MIFVGGFRESILDYFFLFLIVYNAIQAALCFVRNMHIIEMSVLKSNNYRFFPVINKLLTNIAFTKFIAR